MLTLQDKFHIGSEQDDAESQAVIEAAPSTAQGPSNALNHRQHILQHLAKFTQRAAAIKSTAEAVQGWYQSGGPATATAAAVLPAEALLVLNSEADRGLLHLLDTGLVPAQLELTPGLCGRPDGGPLCMPCFATCATTSSQQSQQHDMHDVEPQPVNLQQCG